MTDSVFIDSNLWIYAAMREVGDKSVLSRKLVENSKVIITTQVINEVSINLLRKYQYTEREILDFIKNVSRYCTVHPLSISTCLKASNLRGCYSLSFWDSFIVAAAIESHCVLLYSEDMQHQQNIEGTQIINPFKI